MYISHVTSTTLHHLVCMCIDIQPSDVIQSIYNKMQRSRNCDTKSLLFLLAEVFSVIFKKLIPNF